jgi:hypothetical protein
MSTVKVKSIFFFEHQNINLLIGAMAATALTCYDNFTFLCYGGHDFIAQNTHCGH